MTDGSEPVILAVDGGASKTDVWVVAADGSLLGAARGAGSNHQLFGMDAAMDNLGATIAEALGAAGVTARSGLAGSTGV